MESNATFTDNLKTSIKTKFGYASAEIGTTLSFYMISSYLTIFYTDAVGLAPAVISGLMLTVRIIEALIAPIAGGIIDQTNSKYGKCRPWLLWGLPFLAAFSILTFYSFDLSNILKIIFAYLSYIGLVIAFSFVDTAKSALVNTITIDSQERVVLNSWRATGANITNVILAGVTMPLILFFGNNATAYSYTNLIYTAISIPALLLAFYTCKETVLTSSSHGGKISIKDSLLSSAKNKQLLSLMLYNVLTLTGIFSRLGVMTYYYIYSVGRPELVGGILMTFQIGQLLPPFIVPKLTEKFGKKATFFIANIGQSLSLLLMYFSGYDQITLIFVGSFLLGFFMMNSLTTFGATSDCIEYSYYKFGTRAPGAAVGAITLSVKTGLALGGSIGIFLIGIAGYSAGVEMTMDLRNNINLVANVFPIVMFVLGLFALIPFNLSNKRVAEIQKHNEETDKALQDSHQ